MLFLYRYLKGLVQILFSYLFGSVSAVSRQDLWIVVSIAIIVILFLGLFFKEFFVLSFDEEYAKASGLPAKWIHILFMIVTALVIAGSMRIVGILLVSSLMTLPVAAAMRIAKSFKQAIIYSVVFGELAVLVGLVSAFYLNIAPGGTIVVTSIIILLLTLLTKKLRIKGSAITMNINRAWEILKKEGFKKTDKREQILDIFSQTTKYITPRDILRCYDGGTSGDEL